mmetsp:Transcript_1694/g.3721  ORF Transcript_1694/g.3721 Transcript_1694/m.3721 type:complete len:201 (+) Transcript_1694:1499-2101(+)
MRFPASGEYRAATVLGLTCGSSSKTSSFSRMRRFFTPFFSPLLSRSLRIGLSFSDFASTRDPFFWYPKCSSESSFANIWLPGQQNLARTEPGLSSKPAWTMPELPLVAPWVTSSAASSRSTEILYLESSRAMEEPTQPAPTMTTSYEPSGLADWCLVALRGQTVLLGQLSQVSWEGVGAPEAVRLNLPAQSSISTQSPPT